MYKTKGSVYFIIKSYVSVNVEYFLFNRVLTRFAYSKCLPIENTNTKCPLVYKMEVKRTRIFV